MPALLNRFALLAALALSISSHAADAPPAEAALKAKLQFERSSGRLSVVKARVEVNGRRVTELGKGETGEVLIEPGRTLIKIDTTYSPGQMVFSFTSEKGSEYRFEIFDSIDKMDADHLFGRPPKVSNGEVLEASGVLKALLFSAKTPTPASPEPAPVRPPAKTETAAPVAASPAVQAAPASASVKTQLEELKKLFDQGLISNEVYQEKQKKILEGL
ncbi:MAG: SHOCT domain-containing protein [Sulfuritalea sp.]|nr:SHOCT domain-containing protein [Sulfuritalea sp.]